MSKKNQRRNDRPRRDRDRDRPRPHKDSDLGLALLNVHLEDFIHSQCAGCGSSPCAALYIFRPSMGWQRKCGLAQLRRRALIRPICTACADLEADHPISQALLADAARRTHDAERETHVVLRKWPTDLLGN